MLLPKIMFALVKNETVCVIQMLNARLLQLYPVLRFQKSSLLSFRELSLTKDYGWDSLGGCSISLRFSLMQRGNCIFSPPSPVATPSWLLV